MRNISIALSIGIVIIVGAWYAESFLGKSSAKKQETIATTTPPAILPPKEVSLLFVGDIMLDRGVRTVVEKKLGGAYAELFSFVKNDIAQADYSLFNLEGPVSDKGKNVGSIYSFRMATGTLPMLAQIGFDGASFANNHVGDWGKDAFLDTLLRAQDAGLALVGAGTTYDEAHSPWIIKKNGIKIAILGFSDVGPVHMKAGTSTPGIALLSDESLVHISLAKKEADHVVVLVHWGEEYKQEATSRQQEYAHKIVDAGASLVIGHHPHVVGPIEEYNGAVIAYSLGNFVFDQAFSSKTMEGGVFDISFTKQGRARYGLRKVSLDTLWRPSFVSATSTPSIDIESTE